MLRSVAEERGRAPDEAAADLLMPFPFTARRLWMGMSAQFEGIKSQIGLGVVYM